MNPPTLRVMVLARVVVPRGRVADVAGSAVSERSGSSTKGTAYRIFAIDETLRYRGI